MNNLSSVTAEACVRLEKERARKRAQRTRESPAEKETRKKPIGREIGCTELQSLRHNMCNALLLVSNMKLIIKLQSLRHNMYNALLLVSNVKLIIEL